MGFLDIVGGILNALSNSGDVTWYCDGCDAELNRQSGFSTESGTWVCEECGYENDVTEDNILDEDDSERFSIFQNKCDICGGHMRRSDNPPDVWVCEDCGAEAEEDEYGNLVYDDEEYEDDDTDEEDFY